MANLKELDPVQGLVDYVLDIKPYHTKIMEVLIEYVHTELVDIRITDATEMLLDFTYPPEKLEFTCEDDGYDTTVWGSGDRLAITAPNVSITFEDYPAINVGTNSVNINNDQTKDVRVGDTVYISSFVDDYTNVYKIFDVVPGIAGSAAFIIKEAVIPPEFLVPGYTFRAYEAEDNNGTYTVAVGSPGPTTDGTYTTIPVQQSIPSDNPAGSIGLITTIGTNNGYFTVLNVEFDGGSIDSWPDPSDPSTYVLGNDPHTIITLVEPLSLPTFPGSPALDQVHVAYLTTTPIPIEGALHYSREDRILVAGSPVSINQIPNEGNNRLPIVDVTLTGAGSPNSFGAFVLESDFSDSNIFVGDAFKVDSSTGNNGTYTIVSITYNSGTGQTTFEVSETVNNATIDGYGSVFIPANVFIIDGNRISQFTQGRQFDVQGGATEDTFTVLRSTFSQDKTYVRVAEDIFGIDEDEIIVGNLRRHPYGFDDQSPICGTVPETIVAVYMTDTLHFSGLGVDVADDIIVYNMENNDKGGFDVPTNTIINATQPAVPEQPTEPIIGGSPTTSSFQYLWFDTSGLTSVLRQWVRYEWAAIKKAYWFDTTTNLLYYRTKDQYVDTGWVLDSLRVPGFSDFIPAVGEVEQTSFEEFLVVGTETTFTTVASVPNTLGSPIVIDEELLRVFVNDVPAGFTLNSANSFTVTSPSTSSGDIVRAEFYARTAEELNAHVGAFDVIPHTVYHSGVSVDTVNNAYTVSGGNYLDRFVSFNNVIGYNTNDAGSPALHDIEVGTWNATSFPITSVDGTSNTITINGDCTWLFTTGRILRANPSENNYFDFNVVSSVAGGSPLQTVITVTETVTETILPVQSGSPIQETVHSRDLGVIVGSVYDPSSNPITIFVPSASVSNLVDALSYTWVGPVRFDIGLNPTDLTQGIIYDNLGISGEVLGLPTRFDIIDTNVGVGSPLEPDTFTLYYEELVETFPGSTVWITRPVDLGSVFSPGTIFTVAGSYSNGIPSNIETNDAKYVVKSTYYDWGGSPVTGTGNTIITVQPDYDVIPPALPFTVVEVSNNGIGSPASGSPLYESFNTITLAGDHATLISNFISGKFRLDQPLVSASLLYNIITVTDIELVGGNTVLTVQEEFIDEAFTGAIGLIEVGYRGNIFFDETNTAGSPNEFEHGEVVRETFHIGAAPINTASAQFIDELLFGWGDVLRWPIIGVNAAGSPSGSSVDLYGDYTAIIQPNDRIEIKGGAGSGSPLLTNNGPHEAVSVSYNAGTNISTVQLANPIIEFDPPLVNVNVTILSTGAGSPASRTFVIDGEDGLHVNFLRPGETFTVEDGLGSPNSSPNEGTYTVVTSVHDASTDTITVTTIEDIPSDSAAGYIQYVKKDAGFLEMTDIDITSWFQYTIKEIIPTSSEIILNGNAAVDVQSGQEVRVIGTLANDGIVTATSAPTFNALTNTSSLPVAEPLNYGENDIVELPDTNVVKVLGNAAHYLGAGEGGSPATNQGDEFIILGSTGNDGTYVVRGATFDGVYSFITLTTDLPDTTPDGVGQYRDRGGWIESLRYQGIALYFNDAIAVSVAENADAAVLLTGGSFIGAWDYPLWDVASFDEGIESVIHLYSNTF